MTTRLALSPANNLENRLETHTLRTILGGEKAMRVLAAALEAAEPGAAVARYFECHDHLLKADERKYDLERFGRIFLVGAGKAVAPMALKAAEVLGERLTSGVVVVKDGYAGAEHATLPGNLQILPAGHPVPDQRGLEAARTIKDLLKRTRRDDLVIVALSGGASALLTSPAPPVALADLQRLTNMLLACGATINEINCLRKHLETLKGGNLARQAALAKVITLVLSDVIGDPLDVIASGPTVGDPSTFKDAWDVLERYRLLRDTPSTILERLQRGLRGEEAETPKPSDPLWNRVHNIIIGGNRQAVEAVLACAQKEGFNTLMVTDRLQGEARQAGSYLASLARQVHLNNQPLARPACLVAGGETTVTLKGSGMGGRNQEVALGAVPGIAGLPDVVLVTLATDGGDGPTDAAGAVVSGDTLQRAAQAGMQPEPYLEHNDSYHFFEQLGDLLKPGPTQTNVNDLSFVFAF